MAIRDRATKIGVKATVLAGFAGIPDKSFSEAKLKQDSDLDYAAAEIAKEARGIRLEMSPARSDSELVKWLWRKTRTADKVQGDGVSNWDKVMDLALDLDNGCDAAEEDYQNLVVDCLANLRHLCRIAKFDFDSLSRSAEGHHTAEVPQKKKESR